MIGSKEILHHYSFCVISASFIKMRIFGKSTKFKTYLSCFLSLFVCVYTLPFSFSKNTFPPFWSSEDDLFVYILWKSFHHPCIFPLTFIDVGSIEEGSPRDALNHWWSKINTPPVACHQLWPRTARGQKRSCVTIWAVVKPTQENSRKTVTKWAIKQSRAYVSSLDLPNVISLVPSKLEWTCRKKRQKFQKLCRKAYAWNNNFTDSVTG